MLITDLDGTLLNSHGALSTANRAALETLGAAGVPRVVATGRSLYSARKVLTHDFPIDFLAFSSGAGIVSWPAAKPLRFVNMSAKEAAQARAVLLDLDCDFMTHAATPENHVMEYRRRNGHETKLGRGCSNSESAHPPPNHDFERRLTRYREFATPGTGERFTAISQLLAIEPPDAAHRLDLVARELSELRVIRTTSPLDHKSCWIEVFPQTAGKAIAAEWLRTHLNVSVHDPIAIGNDYNDQELLDWAPTSYVVANAPAALRALREVVPTNDDDGFAEVVTSLLDR